MAKSSLDQECYARSIGGCQGSINREHYFSEGVLKCIGTVTEHGAEVYGHNLAHPNLPSDKPLDIGKLWAGILCEKHNNALSEFDKAGKAMCETSECLYLATLGQEPLAAMPSVNGDDFERWMLKALCGALYSGRVWKPLAHCKGIEPPIEWLEILFNGAKIPVAQGIYWQPTDFDTVAKGNLRDGSFRPLFSWDQQSIIGMQAWFYGLRLDLVLPNSPFSIPFSYGQESYRPSEIAVDGCKVTIRIDWEDGHQNPIKIGLERGVSGIARPT
jgi:hypothetical protein